MKRLTFIVAAIALMLSLASPADAAPKPTELDGSHPAFPLFCDGGPFGQGGPIFGWVVQANGQAGANGALPVAFFYPGGDATGPDLSGDPIVGTSMYRQVYDVTEGVLLREESRGNKTLDQVLDQWDVADCSTPPLPGALLAAAYPDGGYEPGHDYVFRNWVK